MSNFNDFQMKLGEVDIATIKLAPKSHNDIFSILRGFQYIYTSSELRSAVFKMLERVIPSWNGPGLTNEQRHQK